MNSLPKLSPLQLPRASPLYFFSTPPSAGAAWAGVQFDCFSSACYEQKLAKRFGFCYTHIDPYRLEIAGRRRLLGCVGEVVIRFYFFCRF